MNKRPIDKTKKSNIKCEHCKFFDRDLTTPSLCSLKDEKKHYWNRCKEFKWAESEDAE